MKRILTITTLLLVFCIPASAGEIPQPKDCPPDAICPQQAPSAEDPEPESEPVSATILNEAVSLLTSAIVSALS